MSLVAKRNRVHRQRFAKQFSLPEDYVRGWKPLELLEEEITEEIVVKKIKESFQLPVRWHPLRFHSLQQKYLLSPRRFNIVPAGRRSGKTEIGKRRLVKKAISQCEFITSRYIASAPTHLQAKRIFWGDIKALVPDYMVNGRISESELTIPLINGAEILVVGLDKPERVEGPPITHILLDEYGNMKEKVWVEHVRPGLSDQMGTADFIGVPEGRNHYYDLWLDANEDKHGEWAAFTWKSAEILSSGEITAAKRNLDPLTYQQEYEASFIKHEGLIYYRFDNESHIRATKYDVNDTLILCFDFNVDPGVAVVCQEHEGITHCIGEIHVTGSSNTDIVCDRLLGIWSNHAGKVVCYGDPSGGARSTSALQGSDWDIIKYRMRETFGDRLRFDVPTSAPRERIRVNSMNSRLKSTDGTIRMLVNPACKWLVRDLEGVRPDPNGQIDKTDKKITHLTDALGYYITHKFPLSSRMLAISQY